MPRPKPFTLKKGETKILSFWSWKRCGFMQKAIRLDDNGDISVTII